MDFKDLVYLDAIDRQRNLTRAAKELYMTQPALSNFLRNLESTLNTELFRRNGNTLEPTPAGVEYIAFARQTLAEKEKLDRQISLYAYGKGQIRVGIPFSRTEYFADALVAFDKLYPDTEILLEEGSYRDLDEKLRSCRIDLIFTNNPEPDADLIVTPLRTDIFYLYAAPALVRAAGTPCNFSEYPWLDIRQFSECRFLLPPEKQLTGTIGRTVFQECDFHPSRIFPVSNIATMLKLAQKGYGVCLYGHAAGTAGRLPESEHTNLYAFGSHPYTSQLAAVYLRQMRYPQRVQDFIAIVQKQDAQKHQ